MYSFTEESDEELLALRYHLNKVDEYSGVDEDLQRELSSELKKRGIEDEEYERVAVVPIRAYKGMDTALDIVNGDKDEMWIHIFLSDDEVKPDLTDYGYRSKKEAVETAEKLYTTLPPC